MSNKQYDVLFEKVEKISNWTPVHFHISDLTALDGLVMSMQKWLITGERKLGREDDLTHVRNMLSMLINMRTRVAYINMLQMIRRSGVCLDSESAKDIKDFTALGAWDAINEISALYEAIVRANRG